ncbi:SycN family type III secretion system chaperone Acr2 [Aeromonas sp. FDAARGOS 1417]|uniref:SycN family type III secretion system chaperone Acr2 n=1 Tax=Aeromonas TaxID=642 RepID=UPI001C219361|nr:SycN family type III secretion system chaperone Acr2 [Aeromonas sp. FDAARGOS 1417]QWZ65562.1 SycN family type III secretion system chaperone Acr2 [Aeromonas sp. FDAARGOS 1417]
MNWIEPLLVQFCQDLGITIGDNPHSLIQLELEQSGTLQLERHQGQLILWLARAVPWHQSGEAIRRAMTLTAAAQGPTLPVRSGWLGEDQLILFVTLDERAVTLPQLHQAVTTLTRLQREVLAS